MSSKAGGKAMSDQSPMIELHRLHRFFGATRAVCDVSFSVHRGEVFGFIGPNGAGKTTAMRILATLDLPSFGDARVDGFSVVDDPDRVRRRLGFMPDTYGTYSNVDCGEYLDFFARAYGLRGRERKEALERVLSFTGLDQLVDKPTVGLSKGMKQRLCLGRALVHDPSVLILDEPAAGLDPRARIELREMMRALVRQGKTILVSSHILTELSEICDRVGIIEQGQLLATGTVDEIQQRMPARRIVQLTILGPTDACHRWLLERPDVSQLSIQGQQFRFAFGGDQSAEARLLRELILADFPVTAFGGQQRSLEDLFMHVTRGAIQ
jgi:ABC-2 type transport system ATP-binding protein